MDLAQREEERDAILKFSLRATTPNQMKNAQRILNPLYPQASTNFQKQTVLVRLISNHPSFSSKPISTFKRLIDTKRQAKKEKGLCNMRDERFTIGHHCRNKELQVMVIRENEEEDPGEVMNRS